MTITAINPHAFNSAPVSPAYWEDEVILTDSHQAPTKLELIGVIISAGFSHFQASRTVRVLDKAVTWMECWCLNIYHLTNPELAVIHPVLEMIMPDDVPSQPGTIHRAIEEHFFGIGSDIRLTHTRVPGREAEYCAVALTRGTTRQV